MTETVRSRIVQGLAGIPPEIAHQILDDLTLSDILKLACYDIPYINDCIMSHPACGKFFANSSEAFILTRDYFRLYRELQVIRCEKTVPLDSFLAASLSWASFDCREVQRWMHTRIFRTLDLTRDQVDLLCPYAPPQSGPLTMVWDSSTLSALQNRREIIRSAQADLNRIKSHQLERAASLLEENPDILQMATDPDQIRRSNTAHTVSRLRRTASRVACQDVLADTMKGIEYFRNAFFPVVPFNHALGFVVRMLQRYLLLLLSLRVRVGTQSR